MGTADLPPLIFGLPNETLDEIGSYLATPDQRSVVLACTRLHDVVCRQLYRHITVVTYNDGSNLFHTLATSKAGYAAHTRTIHYGSKKVYFDANISESFSKAFPMLKGLEHLSLDLQCPPPLTAFLAKKSLGHDNILSLGYDLPPLPNLRSFQLNGDLRLLVICQYGTIQKLTLTDPLSSEELQCLLNILGCNGRNTVLKELKLTFSILMDEVEIASSLFLIDAYCPNVEVLDIQAVKVDALEMSRILTTTDPMILENLTEISMNKVTLVMPTFDGPHKRHLLGLQGTHLRTAGILRPSLSQVAFGAVKWVRNINTDDWKIGRSQNTINEFIEIQRFPDNRSIDPLFWGIFYREPTPPPPPS